MQIYRQDTALLSFLQFDFYFFHLGFFFAFLTKLVLTSLSPGHGQNKDVGQQNPILVC